MAATSTEMTLIVRARNRASKELNSISKSLRKVTSRANIQKKAFEGLKKVGSAAILGMGLAVGAFVAKGIKDFASFDDKMTQSLAIMGDEAEKWRGKMEKAAREVGKTTTFSASQAAEAYFFLASAGFDAQQSIAAMPQVASFAQAGMFDLATATDLATDAQSALGMKSDNAKENLTKLTRVTDVLVKANTLANATVEQFATALTNKAGAALKVVNKDIEEGVAVLAAFADQGIKGARAGTALNIVFREMQTKAIKNEQAFKDMNIAVFDSAGKMRNVGDIVADLETTLEGMTDKQKKATLAQLGFSDKSVIFIQTLLGTSDAIKGYEEDLRDAGGMTKEVADKQLTSITSQFKLLMSRVQDTGISLASDLLPGLLELAKDVLPKIVDVIGNFREGMRRITDWWKKQPDLVKKVITVLGLVAIALAALSANPIMAGLALVAAAVAFIGSNAADTKRNVDLMKTDLEEIGRVKFGTFEKIFGKELNDNLRDAGVSAELLNEAISGPLTDNQSVARIHDLINANSDLDISWEDVRDTLFGLNVAYKKEQDALQNVADEEKRATMMARNHKDALRENLIAANNLGGELGDLETATSDVNFETEQAIRLTKDMAGALLAQSDPVFGAIDSYQNLQETLKRVDEDGHRTAKELLEVAEATLGTQDAFNNLSAENIEDAIDGLTLALGLSKWEAEQLLNELGLLDGTDVTATATFEIFSHDNTGGNIPKNVFGNIEWRAKGGPTKAGQPYIVGEEGPELWTSTRSGFIHPAGSFDSGTTPIASNGGDTYIVLNDVDLNEGSRKTLMRIREGIRQLDRETL